MWRHGVLLMISAFIAEATWPQFRGPGGQGVSTETGLPVQWSATEGVAWKTPVPGLGWSSPIVWGDRVFVTTATEEGASCRALSLDRKTGRLLWDVELLRQPTLRKETKNSYATPTPVTDGRRVYVACADGSFAAVDFTGKVVWTNRDFPHYSQHGLGTSPILHEDLLIMARDGSSDGENKKVGWQIPWDKSRVLAHDRNTGKLRWEGKRGMSRIAHVTPAVLRHEGGSELISGAGDVVQSFDLKTGERRWSAPSQGEGVVPSVVIGDGLIYTVSGFEKPTIRAHRYDGTLAWEQVRGVPMISSLVYVKPHLYSITMQGIAWCYKGDTGDVVWQGRVGGNHSASPVAAGGKAYFSSEEGEVTVIEAGPEFKVISRNAMGEKIQASPAISRGQIFLRTEGHVYAIGKAR